MAWFSARVAAIALAGMGLGAALTATALGQCYGVWTQAELGYQNGHAMLYDSVHQRVILQCPDAGSGAPGGTRSWEGTRWTRLAWDGPRPARQRFAMAYDSARDRVVLFEG